MAVPMTARQLAQVLRAEGLTVVETPGWETRHRNAVGPWGPVHGVMIHHTVTAGTDATVRICRDGYAGLPGPLCHGVIAKDGTVHLVGGGRANHAGLGDGDVLRAVIAETRLPADNEADVDGNARFYGFECINLGDGRDPWPPEQVEAMRRAAAAVCRHHGWTARSVLGHQEWQPGKVDPRGVGMDDLRALVAARLGQDVPDTPPAPARPTVSLPRLITAARTDPARPGTPVTYPAAATVEAALVDEGLLARRRLDGHWGTATRDAYAAWQRACGYTGAAADGIPGRASLTRLGARHGFDVKE